MKQGQLWAWTIAAVCAVGMMSAMGCGGDEPATPAEEKRQSAEAAPAEEAAPEQTQAAPAEAESAEPDPNQAFDSFPGPDWKDLPDPSASPYAVPGGTLIYAGSTPPKSFNGYLDNNTFTMMVFGLLYPSMLALDTRTGDYGPSLADRWQISKDKRIFVFHINERARWSDGSPVTAHDVKATFDAVTAKESLTGQYQVLFNDIERAEVVDAPDPDGQLRTIRFICKRVHWRNFGNLGGSLYIMPKALIDEARAKCRDEGRDEKLAFNDLNFNLHIVGGPYYVSEHREGRDMTLSRRPDWWGFQIPSGQGVYNFDKIRIRFFMDPNNAYEAFKKGEVDAYAVYSARIWHTESVGERFEKNWIVKQNVRNHAPVGFQGLAINMRRPPYDDPRVRQALALLFDRERMVRSLMYNAYFLQNSFCRDLYDDKNHNTNPDFAYNPDRAVALLREAGFRFNPESGKLERDGQPFVVRLLTRSASDATYLALFKESLARLGIDLAITQRDFATWMREMKDYNFDVTVAAFSGSLFRDPEAMWSSAYANTSNGPNLPGFQDPRVDALIERQKTEFSLERRNEIMRQIDKIATETVPYVLTWGTDSVRLLYWNKFGTPDSVLGKYGDELSIPIYWWYDADSARELQAAMRDNTPLPARAAEVDYDAVTAP